MAIKEFSDQLKKRLDEAMGFGFVQKSMPIQQMNFPEPTKSIDLMKGDVQPEQNEQPPASTQTVVTNSETTPINEPRSDIEAQNQSTEQVNSELAGEISSLLITIGFLLSKEGIVPDKFNTGAVIEFLNKHFKQKVSPAISDVPSELPVDNGATTDLTVATPAPQTNTEYEYPQINAIMEARKMTDLIIKTPKPTHPKMTVREAYKQVKLKYNDLFMKLAKEESDDKHEPTNK